jgi:uncharacterized RDD family membrane protein YckC
MQCKHCGFGNGEDDHRCLRCGRRLSGVVIAAPPGYSGANALARAPMANATLDQTLDGDTLSGTSEFLPLTSALAQTAMFGDAGKPAAAGPRKVIQFDQWQRPGASARVVITPAAATAPVVTPAQPAPQRSVQRRVVAKTVVEQGTLDFVPSAGSGKARKLKTDVDAQIFCDQPVATLAHRCVASAIDAAMILIGFGLVAMIVETMGGSFGVGKIFWLGLGGTFSLVVMFYGLVWAIAGRETAGMRFTDLELITFDGFPLDARSRALRFASSWLSFCSGGLGLFWAVADEENLTWHDHISKTFPTIREAPRSFVKQRR